MKALRLAFVFSATLLALSVVVGSPAAAGEVGNGLTLSHGEGSGGGNGFAVTEGGGSGSNCGGGFSAIEGGGGQCGGGS